MNPALALGFGPAFDTGFFAALLLAAAFAAGFTAVLAAGLGVAALAAGFWPQLFCSGLFRGCHPVTSKVVNSGRLFVSGCARESMIACPWKRKR